MFRKVRSVIVILLLLTAGTLARARDSDPDGLQPQSASVTAKKLQLIRPFIFGGLVLGGDGYKRFAGQAGFGAHVETHYFMFQSEFAFQNSRRVYARTGQILSGSVFGAFFKRDWYAGGGAQWGSVMTDSKRYQGWRPIAVGGKDVIQNGFSMRVQLTYALPALDHSKDRPGGEFEICFPSPATEHHFFICNSTAINLFPPVPKSSSHEDFLTIKMGFRF